MGAQLAQAVATAKEQQDACDKLQKRVALAENEAAVFKKEHAELKEQLHEVRRPLSLCPSVRRHSLTECARSAEC